MRRNGSHYEGHCPKCGVEYYPLDGHIDGPECERNRNMRFYAPRPRDVLARCPTCGMNVYASHLPRCLDEAEGIREVLNGRKAVGTMLDRNILQRCGIEVTQRSLRAFAPAGAVRIVEAVRYRLPVRGGLLAALVAFPGYDRDVAALDEKRFVDFMRASEVHYDLLQAMPKVTTHAVGERE